MGQAQTLGGPLAEADLSVSESDYFGWNLRELGNRSAWPFFPGDGPLTRTSYVYQAIYQIGSGKNKEYGGIQIRARLHTYGEPPNRLRRWLERTAHRAAYMFDSGIQTPGYAPPGGKVRGTQGGDGYLSGFNAVESYQNYEQERIAEGEMNTRPGVIDWSTEVYVDTNFKEAELSGIAQGISYPYEVTHRSSGGSPAVNVAPHKWEITWNPSKDGGNYDVHPPGGKKARQRYQPGGAAHDKTVYINNKPIGKLDAEGRTWLKPEYSRGNGHTTSGAFGTYWSREGLVAETGATYQALRKGGVLYFTGETENAIHLVTAAEKPPGYEAGDPDSVSIDMEVSPGSDPVDVYLLTLQDADESLRVECRRDDKKIKHLGRSNPHYTHLLGPRQTWRASA